MTNNKLTISKIIENGVLFEKKVDDFEYDHVFIYGYWRFFYSLDGNTAPKDISDSNQDGIPDYIDSMLYKLETARILFCDSFTLDDPTIAGFYFDLGVKYIDIYIQNIPKPKGLVSNQVFDHQYEILNDSLYQGKSLLIRLDRNLIPKTSVPMHELFHLFQFNYTQIANLWFMEGIGRWAQFIFQKRELPEYRLPSTQKELESLLDMAHDAEVFWNRLADFCVQENEFVLPDSLQENSVFLQQNRTGIAFVKTFLPILRTYSHLVVDEQKDRKLSKDSYWKGTERRSYKNNKTILAAMVKAINETCHHKTQELMDFLHLVHPIISNALESYNTSEIQLLMKFLHKLDNNYCQIENNIYYSEFFIPLTGTLTLDLELSNIILENDELDSLLALKHLKGSFSLINNHKLTNLAGLSNLESVSGNLTIRNNFIEELNGFDNLKKVKKLEISNLSQLTSISGFNKLSDIEKLIITANDYLTSINGFTYLEKIESLLNIENNNLLEAINGFNSLSAIANGSLEIKYNSNLNLINGFCSLLEIKNTLALKSLPQLQNINFLSSLITLKNLYLNNVNINSTQPLNSLFNNVNDFPGYIKILNCYLTNLSFLQGVKSIGSSFYLHNNKLFDLSGLEHLERVGASFSLPRNRLNDISQLSNLTSVGGMLGLANNQLTSLNGLENLIYLRTIKWNGKPTSLSLQGNPDLVDIQGLSHIHEKNNNIVILMDNKQNFNYKPNSHSQFSSNKISILDAQTRAELEIDKVCTTVQWTDFEAIAQCASGHSCHLCRNQKYGYAWRQTLQSVVSLPPGGIDFNCPYGKSWTRYGYLSKSQQLSDILAEPLSIQEQFNFASNHMDEQSFPKYKWGSTIDVVYPYFSVQKDNDDELRYSLRSLSNLHEQVNVWIVGDKPDWLNLEKVNYIPHSKQKGSSRYIDSRAKVKLAAQNEKMGSHFLYMNDDLYFIVPVSAAYIGIPRYFADYTDSLDKFKINVEYNKLELKGLKALEELQRPMRNYGLHWPYMYKSKLYLEIYEEFKLDKNAHNSETLYYNTHAKAIIPYGNDLLRSNEVVTEDFNFDNIPKDIMVLNNKEKGFRRIKGILSQLFPQACDYEN
jgi:hypothetical protein